MGEWQRYPVDPGSEYESIQVEARQSPEWVEWRGLPGTPFETWIGSGPGGGCHHAASSRRLHWSIGLIGADGYGERAHRLIGLLLRALWWLGLKTEPTRCA